MIKEDNLLRIGFGSFKQMNYLGNYDLIYTIKRGFVKINGILNNGVFFFWINENNTNIFQSKNISHFNHLLYKLTKEKIKSNTKEEILYYRCKNAKANTI